MMYRSLQLFPETLDHLLLVFKQDSKFGSRYFYHNNKVLVIDFAGNGHVGNFMSFSVLRIHAPFSASRDEQIAIDNCEKE